MNSSIVSGYAAIRLRTRINLIYYSKGDRAMRTKIYSIMLIIALLLSMVMPAYAADQVTVLVNEEELQTDQPAEIYDGRTFLPLRAVAEAVGAEVEWDSSLQSAKIKSGTTVIAVDIGSTRMRVNRNGAISEREVDAPARLINNRTMVPIRAVAEELGLSVDWNDSARQVIIVGGKPKMRVIEGTRGANTHENCISLFDSNSETKWCVTQFNSAYVIWKATVPVAATGYTIVTGADCSRYSGRNPMSWTLYGCNSDSVPDKNYSGWIVVDKRSNDKRLEDKNSERYDYKIAGIIPAYTYYKLEISAVKGANVMQMAEFMLDYDGRDYKIIKDSSQNDVYDKEAAAESSKPSSSTSSSPSTSSQGSSGSPGGGSISVPRNTQSTCSYCGGKGSRNCNTCGGKGYVEVRSSSPNYSGKKGSGGSSTVRKSCSNILCHGGKVDCSFCGGTGRR